MGRARQQVGVILLAYALAMVAGYAALRRAEALGAGFWLLVSALVAAYALAYTWRNLGSNMPSDGHVPFPDLGLANAVTLLRGGLIAMIAGFVCFGRPSGAILWAPAVLYTIAAAMDGLDGKIARATGRVSRLGISLDMEFDSIGVLVASAVAVRYGQLPVWYIFVGLARYLFLAGTWVLKVAGRTPAPLPPSRFRRFMAGTMMTFLALSLYPVFPPYLLLIFGAAVFVPFAFGFVRDFLYVGGWLTSEGV
jgi:CDP-diacylglycerol--glycerol-3-phosphate 3-phosphatidyltransferase